MLGAKSKNIFESEINNTANLEVNDDNTVFIGLEAGSYVFAGFNIKIGFNVNLND